MSTRASGIRLATMQACSSKHGPRTRWSHCSGSGHDDALANAIELAVVESSIRLRDAQTRLAGTFAKVVSGHGPAEPLRRRAISMRRRFSSRPTTRRRRSSCCAASTTRLRSRQVRAASRRAGPAPLGSRLRRRATPARRIAAAARGHDDVRADARAGQRAYARFARPVRARVGAAGALRRSDRHPAWARRRDTARLSATDPLLANTRHNLAVWLIRQGRPLEALPILAKLLDEQSAGGDADRPVEAWIEIGAARAALGDGAAACIAAREAVSLAGKPAVSDESRQNARFADALRIARSGRFDESIAVLETVLVARSARNGSNSRNALNTRAALARVYLDAGRPGDARQELEALAAATEVLREREMPDSALGRTGFSAYTESTSMRAGVRDLAFLDAREGRIRDAIARAESARARSVTDAFGWRVALTAMSQRDQVRNSWRWRRNNARSTPASRCCPRARARRAGIGLSGSRRAGRHAPRASASSGCAGHRLRAMAQSAASRCGIHRRSDRARRRLGVRLVAAIARRRSSCFKTRRRWCRRCRRRRAHSAWSEPSPRLARVLRRRPRRGCEWLGVTGIQRENTGGGPRRRDFGARSSPRSVRISPASRES